MTRRIPGGNFSEFGTLVVDDAEKVLKSHRIMRFENCK